MTRAIVNTNKIMWMMVLGTKIVHIIDGAGAEHPGMAVIFR
jgi:hypothetical protein